MIAMKIALSAIVLALPISILINVFGDSDMEAPKWFVSTMLAALAACGVAFFGSVTVAALMWVWAL